MRGAEPFYFKGNAVGCLLLHGMTGTPKEVRGIGEQLAACGYTALGVRLAGHGTHGSDLHSTCWTDWYTSALHGSWRLRDERSPGFVVGYSPGGVLPVGVVAGAP